MKLKILTAALTFTFSSMALSDQMVIDGNAIRDGDGIGKLVQYAGRPLTTRTRTVCLNQDCTAVGTVEIWIYLHDNIQYSVTLFEGTITAIDWRHSH